MQASIAGPALAASSESGTPGMFAVASRGWVADAEPTIADFACCGYLYYPEPFGFDRKDWLYINRWLDAISALPGWKHPYDLMPGNPSDRAPKEDT